MNKLWNLKNRASSNGSSGYSSPRTTAYVFLIIALVLCGLALLPSKPQAQRSAERGAKLTDVTVSQRGGQKVVSISGEGSMSRVQTWQDPSGEFHVVFPHGSGNLPSRTSGGIRTQRIGDSIEIIIPASRGATVTVQPRAGNLELIVNGDLNDAASEARQRQQLSLDSQAPARERRGDIVRRDQRDETRSQKTANENPPTQSSERPARQLPPQTGATDERLQPLAESSQPAQAQSETDSTNHSESQGEKSEEKTANVAAQATAATEVEAPSDESSGYLSITGMALILCLLSLSAIFYFIRRRRQSGIEEADGAVVVQAASKRAVQSEPRASHGLTSMQADSSNGDRRKNPVPVEIERRNRNNGTAAQSGAAIETVYDKMEGSAVARMQVAGLPAVLFGAYRIDQEIDKLLHGEPHAIEVLASRATDDRRAVETSLLKALSDVETSEEARFRVSQALNDYGFVARQSAALLLSPDTYERVSAARVLSQIKSKASLPFLLEALYDNEQVVRAEVVSALGSLAQPRTIGALIDVARRYPEMPPTLVSTALTACSFDAQEYAWGGGQDISALPHKFASENETGEFFGHEVARTVEQLPEWLEDENFSDALERLESADVEVRLRAAQTLGQYSVGRSVKALASILERDNSSAVRATAVTSLGLIDHESVLVPILIALGDGSREVRAAAARAFSTIEFDRGEACARLIEMGEPDVLKAVASACVRSGLTMQAANRLASEDRRQAYEAFSFLSLVVRGGESDTILDIIETHRDLNVRLACVRLASLTGDARLFTKLRELLEKLPHSPEVRIAIKEAVGGGAHVRN